MIIELDNHTPVNLENLPAGFTPDDAQEVRAPVICLRSKGLHVLFAVAADDRAFQFASGDSRVLASVAAETSAELGQFGKERGRA